MYNSGIIILQDGTDMLFRNVGSYQLTLRNIPEEWIPQLHRGESLKSRIFCIMLVKLYVSVSCSIIDDLLKFS